MESLGTKILTFLTLYGMRLLGSLAIFYIGKVVAMVVTGVVEKTMYRAKANETLIRFVHHLAYYGMMAFVVMAALANIGIQTASFVAVFGAAGLAVGLALQGSLSNFAAGVMLILFRPFKVGDYIEAGGGEGEVLEIQLFTTIVRTLDNRQIIIPNNAVTSSKIINFTAEPYRQVIIKVGVSYGDDLRKVQQALQDLLAADARVLKEPAPQVYVGELNENGVQILVRPFVKHENYWPVFFELQEKIKLKFDEEHITIPLPQRTVHVLQSSAKPDATRLENPTFPI